MRCSPTSSKLLSHATLAGVRPQRPERGPFQAAMTLNFSLWRNDWVWLPAGRIWCRCLFYFLFFIFIPKKHTTPHPHNVPAQTIPRRSTITSTTTLCSLLVHSVPAYSLVSARALCSEPRRSRTCCSRHVNLSVHYLEPCQPVSLQHGSPIFVLLPIFACCYCTSKRPATIFL